MIQGLGLKEAKQTISPHLKIMWTLMQVENVEEYIKLLQDHIALAESTYKMCVKELREDANFRSADEIVLSLTGQATSAVDVAATLTPSYIRRGSSNDLDNID